MSPPQTALHENAEVVRRGYHGFNTADMNLLTQIFHEESSSGREYFFDTYAWDEFWA